MIGERVLVSNSGLELVVIVLPNAGRTVKTARIITPAHTALKSL